MAPFRSRLARLGQRKVGQDYEFCRRPLPPCTFQPAYNHSAEVCKVSPSIGVQAMMLTGTKRRGWGEAYEFDEGIFDGSLSTHAPSPNITERQC